MLFAGFNVAEGEYSLFVVVARRRRGERRRLLDRLRGRLLRPRRPAREARAQGLHQAAPPALGRRLVRALRRRDGVLLAHAADRPHVHLAARGRRQMPFWRFTVLTALGCIPWVFMLVFIGKQAGDHWESWKDNLHYVDYAVVAAIVLGARVAVRALRGGGARTGAAADAPPPELAAGRRARADPGRGRAAAGLLVRARRGGAAAAALGGRGRGRRRGARSSRSRCTRARCSALGAGALAAAPGRARRSRSSLAPPVIVGLLFERRDRGAARQAGGLAAGLLARARLALAAADRGSHGDAPRARTPTLRGRASWLGRARRPRRSCPGVSRTGATLAAARALGLLPRRGFAALVRRRRARARRARRR